MVRRSIYARIYECILAGLLIQHPNGRISSVVPICILIRRSLRAREVGYLLIIL
jgi:hypothetical protein